MTDHLHSKVVEGCYRCELGKDEEEAGLNELRKELVRRIWYADADRLYVIEGVLDL